MGFCPKCGVSNAPSLTVCPECKADRDFAILPDDGIGMSDELDAEAPERKLDEESLMSAAAYDWVAAALERMASTRRIWSDQGINESTSDEGSSPMKSGIRMSESPQLSPLKKKIEAPPMAYDPMKWSAQEVEDWLATHQARLRGLAEVFAKRGGVDGSTLFGVAKGAELARFGIKDKILRGLLFRAIGVRLHRFKKIYPTKAGSSD